MTSIVAGSFFMNYNATLCKEALGKKLLAQVTECKCYCTNNCDGNFFRSVGKEWQLKCKIPLKSKQPFKRKAVHQTELKIIIVVFIYYSVIIVELIIL